MSKRSLGVAESPSATKKAKMTGALANGSSNKPQSSEIDEDLHSRQLAVYGRASMRRLAASQVLIIGLDGLGVEVGAWLRLQLLPAACIGLLSYLLIASRSVWCSQECDPGWG